MKTLQELYEEVLKSAELKNAFAEAVQNKTVGDFLKAHGCDASPEELAAFLKERQSGELADDELDSVSGGCNKDEAALSAVTFGFGCIAVAVESAYRGDMKGLDGKILCKDQVF